MILQEGRPEAFQEAIVLLALKYMACRLKARFARSFVRTFPPRGDVHVLRRSSKGAVVHIAATLSACTCP